MKKEYSHELLEEYKDTPRHCTTSKRRVESVAEHSWRVALMALLLRNEFPETDIDRVVGMCLVHDLGECFTGDIKLEALIQHNESPLDTWAENEYELNRTYAFDTVAFQNAEKNIVSGVKIYDTQRKSNEDIL